MSGLPSFIQRIASAKAAAGAQSNYTTAKSVINGTDTFGFPANALTVGTQLKIEVIAALSNVVTAQPTVTLQVMLGSTAVWTSGALTTTSGANTNATLKIVVDMTLRVDGASAQFMGIGQVECAALATPRALYPAAPALGTAFDSTGPLTLDFWAGFSAASASTGITVHHYAVYQSYFGQ